MPPSGFSLRAIEGLLMFTEACYADLEKEVASGKHPDFLSAIQHEQRQIQRALGKLHITNEGELIEKLDPDPPLL